MTLSMYPKRRKAIYAAAASIAVALAFFGVIKGEAVAILLGVVYTLVNLLAVLNVDPKDDPSDEELGG